MKNHSALAQLMRDIEDPRVNSEAPQLNPVQLRQVNDLILPNMTVCAMGTFEGDADADIVIGPDDDDDVTDAALAEMSEIALAIVINIDGAAPVLAVSGEGVPAAKGIKFFGTGPTITFGNPLLSISANKLTVGQDAQLNADAETCRYIILGR